MLVVVDASIFASFLFAHLHVSMLASVCPPPGARLPDGESITGAIAMSLVSALLMGLLARRRTGKRPLHGRIVFAMLLTLAFGLAAAAWASGWVAHEAVGLSPRANAWSATVAALMAWQGFHVAVLAVMALYLLARRCSGRLTAGNRATLDNIALFWHYTLLQGAVALAVVQWLPEVLAP